MRPVTSSSPTAVFQKLGLRTRRSWHVPVAGAHYHALPPASRLRNALEELGGLYGSFAQFLCWRADLLPTDYLGSLRQVRVRTAPIPRDEFARALTAALGKRAEPLVQNLDVGPCWSSPWRCAYKSRHDGRLIVLQLARDPLPDAAFEDFQSGVEQLDEEIAAGAFSPGVLDQFRQWVRLSDSPARERSFLETLSGMRDKTLVEYPRLIPELSTEKALCWQWIDGEPAATLLGRGSPEVVCKIAEAILEQLCILSVVDGDLDLDAAMVVTASGRVAVRRANRLVAVPAPMLRPALKYVAAVLAGNSGVAAHALLKMTVGRTPMDLESRLLDELSHLQPELKVNMRFPASATVLEGNWRALARTGIEKPLFLDCLHRNLVAVGYWNAEAAPSADCIAEAQWPVLGRLLRARVGDLLNREAASEWLVGSGLLFFEALRQMNRLADEFRDNDLSILVDAPGPSREESQKANRTVRSAVLTGMLVIVFLVCLRWAASAPAPFSTVLAAVAAAAAVGLFWTVFRIG